MERLELNQNELELFAQSLGLSLNSDSRVISGCYNHYKLSMEKFNQAGYAFALNFALSQSDTKPQKEVLETVGQEVKEIGECVVENYQVTYKIQGSIATGDLVVNVKNLLNVLTDFFTKNQFVSSCSFCGSSDNPDFIVRDNGAVIALCANCSSQQLSSATMEATIEMPELKEVKENWLLGTLGAFLGSLVGVAAQIIIGLLGFISGISGIVMAVCSLKGYERLGKKVSKKGIFIVVALMLIMVFVACMLNLSIEIKDAFYEEVTIFDIFTHFFSLMDQVPELKHAFYKDLIYTYIFTLVGALPTINDMDKHNQVGMNNRRKLNS